MELRLFLASERKESSNICPGENEEEKKKKKLEFEGGMRDKELRRVRRGYFNCAKSHLNVGEGL